VGRVPLPTMVGMEKTGIGISHNLRITGVFSCVGHKFNARVSFRLDGCCCSRLSGS
jgi:hypothetical protein